MRGASLPALHATNHLHHQRLPCLLPELPCSFHSDATLLPSVSPPRLLCCCYCSAVVTELPQKYSTPSSPSGEAAQTFPGPGSNSSIWEEEAASQNTSLPLPWGAAATNRATPPLTSAWHHPVAPGQGQESSPGTKAKQGNTTETDLPGGPAQIPPKAQLKGGKSTSDANGTSQHVPLP